MLRLPDLFRLPVGLLAALLVAGLTLASPVRADSGLLSSTLGRWLDTEVLPELGRTLGEHPRFKGETIRLVSLSNGRPADRTSRLHEAVQAHLTQRLLKKTGVRLALSQQAPQSCSVGEQAAYLLGVEIEPDGNNYYHLSIRMIDVAESIWVAGVSHSWHGRLTATEAAALKQPVAMAPRGSVENPLPSTSVREIATTLLRHFRCAHPRGLDGPVYLESTDDTGLNRLLAGLTGELNTMPLAALTANRDDAEWTMTLRSRDIGAGSVLELDLMLTELGGGVTQQVATVYITARDRGIQPRPADTRIAAGGTTSAAGTDPDHYPPSALLSDMQLLPAASDGICAPGKLNGDECAEVGFELYQDAYLFVLSSSNRTLTASRCDARLESTSAGERRFRIRVPRSDSPLPDAGVYAIAVRDRGAARDLSRHIRSGICGRPLPRGERWLTRLDNLLAEHSDAIEWRAIHLSHAGTGVVRF